MTGRLAALPLAMIVALLAFPAAGVSAKPVRRFQMPSKRIVCEYQQSREFPPQLRCDLLFLNDRAVILAQRGKGRLVKVTDAVSRRGANVLRYGRRLRLGNFTCTSRRTGLTCRHRRTKHGFTVSAQRQKLF